MEKNLFYMKGKRTKENPYGLYKVDDPNLLSKPTVITLIPSVFNDNDLNGASKHVGYALGLIAEEKQASKMSECGVLSWDDVNSLGVNFVSVSVTNTKQLFDYYFKNILYDNNGNIKSYEDLLLSLRNINIVSFCNSTKTVQEIEKLLTHELEESGAFSEEQIKHLLLQICSIDVTTRIQPGNSSFTSVHLFSKGDQELKDPEYVERQKSGITVLENENEANIVVDSMTGDPENEHDFAMFFGSLTDDTSQAKVMEVVTGMLVSNMVQSSLEGKVLSKRSIKDCSLVFDDKISEMFNFLLSSEHVVTDEEYAQACEHLKTSRQNKHINPYLKDKESIFMELKRNSNMKLFASLTNKINDKIKGFRNYIIIYKKFKNSEYYKKLDENQQLIFETVCDEVEERLKIAEDCLKAIESLDLSNIEDNDKNKEKLEQIKALADNIIDYIKTKSVINAYAEITRYEEPGYLGNFASFEDCEDFLMGEINNVLEK